MRVLIVDDDEAYVYLVQRILQGSRHEVLACENAEMAWKLIREKAIQFVITDWMLPEMDGLELIRRIRQTDLPHYVYVILLTAKQSKDDVVDGLDAGADDYITKPFDANELKARVKIGERILGLEARLRDAMNQLALQAMFDSLTGLPNRRALYEAIDQEFARARREGHPISLVMMDLDHFKSVNDRYGHLVGDDVLCLAARAIQDNKRTYDVAGRWGGEEFLIILPGAKLQAACQVAERIRCAVEAMRLDLKDGSQVSVQASFGVASTEQAGDISFDALLQQADLALYQAKQRGRNQVCVYAEEGNR